MQKTTTYKEPPMEVLEPYFKEIRLGRSRKSVANALRRKGYTISETVLRHRYEVWLAYQQAKEEFEKKLNQTKGEILQKLERKLHSLEGDTIKNSQVLKNFLSIQEYFFLATKEPEFANGLFEQFSSKVENSLKRLESNISQLEEDFENQNLSVWTVIERLQNQNRELQQQIKVLSRILVSVLGGIYQKEKNSGLLDRKDLWDSITKNGLTQELVDKLQELAGNR